MDQRLPTSRQLRRPFLHTGPIALVVCALGFVLLQCKSSSHLPQPSDETTTNVEQTSSSTTERTTSSTSGGDSATTDDSNTTSSGATSGGQGGADDSCPTTWETCPPTDTALEPLHERQNGAGALLLFDDAFWFQGTFSQIQPDGSLGDLSVGALRLPYAPGSTPRVLEGNVATGMFVEHQGKVYHADSSSGRYLAVYEPNGDLHKLVDISEGDTSIFMLTGLTTRDDLVALTSPNCQSVFIVNTDTWQVERIDTGGDYLGGTTTMTFVDDHLYCMGDGQIYKIDVESISVSASWSDPLLKDGVQGLHYRWLWNTPQGLLTWRNLDGPNQSVFQVLDPATLGFSDYFETTIFIGTPKFISSENALYFFDYTGDDTSNRFGLHRFGIAEKSIAQLVPTERPWGGAWDFKSEIEMDDDYFYWIEGFANTMGARSEFIVRYPRNP